MFRRCGHKTLYFGGKKPVLEVILEEAGFGSHFGGMKPVLEVKKSGILTESA